MVEVSPSPNSTGFSFLTMKGYFTALTSEQREDDQEQSGPGEAKCSLIY